VNTKKPDKSRKPVACNCVKIEEGMNTVWIVAMALQKVKGFTTSDCTAKGKNDVFPQFPLGKTFAVTQEIHDPDPRTVKLGSVWFQLNGACQIKSFFQHLPWDKIGKIALEILKNVPKWL
jgi:hypothetical protein